MSDGTAGWNELILADSTGTCYRLTPDLLQHARVDPAAAAALLGETDETTGYTVPKGWTPPPAPPPPDGGSTPTPGGVGIPGFYLVRFH